MEVVQSLRGSAHIQGQLSQAGRCLTLPAGTELGEKLVGHVLLERCGGVKEIVVPPIGTFLFVPPPLVDAPERRVTFEGWRGILELE